MLSLVFGLTDARSQRLSIANAVIRYEIHEGRPDGRRLSPLVVFSS